MSAEVQVQVEHLETAANKLRGDAATYSGTRGSVRWYVGDSGSPGANAAIQELSDAYCATWAGLDDRMSAFAEMTLAAADAYKKADGQFDDDAAPNLYEDNPYRI